MKELKKLRGENSDSRLGEDPESESPIVTTFNEEIERSRTESSSSETDSKEKEDQKLEKESSAVKSEDESIAQDEL
eukprot:10997124-Karenia_brevis.AAC.1